MQELPFRTRPDLIVEAVHRSNDTVWVVKDPIALAYFELSAIETYVLELLESPTSLALLRARLSTRFPDRFLRNPEIFNLIAKLQASGLLISQNGGLAAKLIAKQVKQTRGMLLKTISNVFAIRLPGIYADNFLGVAASLLGWLFSRWAALLVFCFALSALCLVLLNFDRFQHEFPQLSSFFGNDNLAYLAGVMIGTKIIHEMGHGIACKRFGLDCPEIGILLLFFMPAMYCETSDAWRLQDRWKRIVINSAGVYFELLAAAIAAYVWYYTGNNWLHYAAVNTLVVSSVSTVLFNANPLLKYDGYFILSDITEIANLGSVANSAVWRSLRRLCFGIVSTEKDHGSVKQQSLLVAYAIASWIYKFCVFGTMALIAADLLEPYGLRTLSYMLVAMWLIGMIIPSAKGSWTYIFTPGNWKGTRPENLVPSLVVLGGAAYILFFLPLPFHISAPALRGMTNSQVVVAEEAFSIPHLSVQPNQAVSSGHRLGELVNMDIDTQLARVNVQLAKLQSDYELQRLSPRDRTRARESLGEISAEISRTSKQLAVLTSRQSRQTIISNKAGLIVPAENTPEFAYDDMELGSRCGTLFDRENLGCTIPKGTTVVHVIPVDSHLLTLYVNERDLSHIAVEQSVEVLLRDSRDQVLQGTVLSVSRKPIEAAPREAVVANGGWLPANSDSVKGWVPIGTWHEITVKLDAASSALSYRIPGISRIRVKDATIAKRIQLYVSGLLIER